MSYQSSVNITNASGQEVIFHLEPWGEQILMPPGETFTVSAEAQEEGSFEVEYGEGEILVWAWSSAIAKVFCNGKELGGLAGKERPAVPTMPAGKSVSSLLRFMLGKEIKKQRN